MTVRDMARSLGLEAFCLCDGEREVSGGYAGDLLSWVMGRAEEGQVWITIMTNLNILAVATLSGISGILLSENVEIDSGVIKKAEEQGINIIRTAMSTYEAALALGKL